MALDRNITASLIRQSPKIARVQVQKQGKAAFQKIKNRMIAEFLNHPVTVELKQGIDASNISGTLGGVTNLFSFIGFGFILYISNRQDSTPSDIIFSHTSSHLPNI